MANIQFTAVQASDLPNLRDLCIRTFRETFEAGKDPEQFARYLKTAFSEEQLRSEWVRPASEYYFLFAGRTIAGYLMLNAEEAQTENKGTEFLEIQRIYLLEAFQGMGFGKRMIEFIIDRAKALGKTKIWLGVWEENQSAIRFYEKIGFRRVGEHVFMLGDIPERDWIMEFEIK